MNPEYAAWQSKLLITNIYSSYGLFTLTSSPLKVQGPIPSLRDSIKPSPPHLPFTVISLGLLYVTKLKFVFFLLICLLLTYLFDQPNNREGKKEGCFCPYSFHQGSSPVVISGSEESMVEYGESRNPGLM